VNNVLDVIKENKNKFVTVQGPETSDKIKMPESAEPAENSRLL